MSEAIGRLRLAGMLVSMEELINSEFDKVVEVGTISGMTRLMDRSEVEGMRSALTECVNMLSGHKSGPVTFVADVTDWLAGDGKCLRLMDCPWRGDEYKCERKGTVCPAVEDHLKRPAPSMWRGPDKCVNLTEDGGCKNPHKVACLNWYPPQSKCSTAPGFSLEPRAKRYQDL